MQLETERLRIRSFEERDVDGFAALIADAEVMRDIGDGSVQSRGEAEDYVRACMEREAAGGPSRYVVEHRDNGAFLGMCGFRPEEHGTDFGWRLSRATWGRGYATEAARAVLDYGLRSLGIADLYAHAFADNRASLRVIEKLGFRFDEEDRLFGRRVLRYRPLPLTLHPIGRDGTVADYAGGLPESAGGALVGTAAMYERVGYEEPWVGYLAVMSEASGAEVGAAPLPRAVGTCAFKGPPVDGRAEIAYFTFPEDEGRGIASAMAALLLARVATEQGTRIHAQTLPERNASHRILEKLGFTAVGLEQDDDAGEVLEWRLGH